jgi:hypothetical protein
VYHVKNVLVGAFMQSFVRSGSLQALVVLLTSNSIHGSTKEKDRCIFSIEFGKEVILYEQGEQTLTAAKRIF